MPRQPVDRERLLTLLRKREQLHLHKRLWDHGWSVMTEPKSATYRGLCGTDRCLILRLRT